MKHWLGLLSGFALLSAVPMLAQDATPEASAAPKRVVAYYTSWSIYDRDYQVADVPAEMLTHINYAFANISEEGEVVLGDEWADVQIATDGDEADGALFLGNFRQLNLLKERNPNLQTLISVGGWTWSGRFSDVALTPESREKFAISAVSFMKRYGFDGVDLDWEYPAGGGNTGNVERPEDPENFILLLEAVRAELDRVGKDDERHYLLTIATGAGPSTYETLDWERIHAQLDWINVMTYDMAGPWSDVTGFNSPLYASADTPAATAISVHEAIEGYLAEGVPADKLVVGVAFYARAFADVPADNNGLGQTFAGAPAGTWEQGVFDYSDLAANYVGTYERFFDDVADVPWLYSAEEGVMITYDDPESMGLKASYVNEHGLGGIMFWELSSDDDANALLSSIYNGLNP